MSIIFYLWTSLLLDKTTHRMIDAQVYPQFYLWINIINRCIDKSTCGANKAARPGRPAQSFAMSDYRTSPTHDTPGALDSFFGAKAPP